MARVQLALNVTDLDEAVGFYSELFGAEPAKLRPGYANFAIEGTEGGTLNHLGIEVATREEVVAAQRRLRSQGLATVTEDEVACCYSLQDKVWVDAPDGEPWEIYTVLADIEMPAGRLRSVDPELLDPDADALCCASAPASAPRCC
jgi:catechol 2,3-dioxygenase-like lactoylglutathione lyase family enzyme